jgi:hypothetical protein
VLINFPGEVGLSQSQRGLYAHIQRGFHCRIDSVLVVDGTLCGCLPPTNETGL